MIDNTRHLLTRAGAVIKGEGWRVVIYVLVITGAVMWATMRTAQPSKEGLPGHVLAKLITDIDSRLEGLEVAVMGLQAKNQEALKELKLMGAAVGTYKSNAERIYYLLDDINARISTPARISTRKKKRRTTRRRRGNWASVRNIPNHP